MAAAGSSALWQIGFRMGVALIAVAAAQILLAQVGPNRQAPGDPPEVEAVKPASDPKSGTSAPGGGRVVQFQTLPSQAAPQAKPALHVGAPIPLASGEPPLPAVPSAKSPSLPGRQVAFHGSVAASSASPMNSESAELDSIWRRRDPRAPMGALTGFRALPMQHSPLPDLMGSEMDAGPSPTHVPPKPQWTRRERSSTVPAHLSSWQSQEDTLPEPMTFRDIVAPDSSVEDLPGVLELANDVPQVSPDARLFPDVASPFPDVSDPRDAGNSRAGVPGARPAPAFPNENSNGGNEAGSESLSLDAPRTPPAQEPIVVMPRGQRNEAGKLVPGTRANPWEEILPTPSELGQRPNRDMIDRVASEHTNVDKIAYQIASDRILPTQHSVSLDLQTAIALALTHSKNIQVLRLLPAEQQQEVQSEYGQFDWNAFVESVFSQDSQPVGSIGQTNQIRDQVRDDRNEVRFGIRKQTVFGGELELLESLGTRDSNSGLLDPEEPGTSQIAITFSQELLRGGGRDVVLSQALIASLVADQTHAQSFADISNLLREVMVQYWDLYRRRGDYFIQLSLIRWAEQTLELLESRGRIDAEANSIEQARALLLEARANLQNAKAAVHVAQDRLFRLINAPEIDSNVYELLTVEPPRATQQQLQLQSELQEALIYRSEVSQKLTEIRAAAIAHHVSLNQLLPRLTFSIESSLNALDENRDFWGAKRNLSDIDPSYGANLNFEIRLGNRTARAENKRAQLALRRLQFEYEDQIQQVRLDVASALRTLNASAAILDQRRATLEARRKEIDYLRLRRDVIPQQGVSPSLLLEQFFQAINRLVISQQAYVAAVADQQSAMAQLLQSKGLLLNVNQVPRDMRVGVPRLTQAWKDGRVQKTGIVGEAKSRVVLPGRQDNPLTRPENPISRSRIRK